VPAPRYEYSVFINCPFDGQYENIFRAIVFTVQDCGYIPRCSLESDNAAEPRIQKIYRLISESKYGIHDISRTQLDSKFKLPRFNMPLELGIFLGAWHYGRGKQKDKECLVLDSTRYRFMKFCSDISGQDIRGHKNTIKRAVRSTRDWLRARQQGVSIPSSSRILKRYYAFRRAIPIICTTLTPPLDPDQLTYNDFTFVIGEWLSANPW